LSKVLAYAATSKTSPMAPITISRREPRSNDVNIEILYCGVCHTDIHTAHGEWDGLIYPNGTIYPCVPGHEIVGRVTSIGPDVKGFTLGEFVAVGTMVDSCLECNNCRAGLEPYCEKYATWTYNAPDRTAGDNTQGALLRHGGTMALVGIPEKPHPSPSVATLIGLRRSLAGSLVGGIKETQEMLDFCAEHGVVAETETIPMQEIETAFARMVKNDVKYRFVVDMKSLKQHV
jgi:D-arabinose 1-dehydrogenase-like Zn-dependent alcohol dehydrogenase